MVEKVLIIENNEYDDGTKGITQLVGNPKDETLYAEYKSSINSIIEYDTIELAVNVKQMIKIRDYLTKLINKTGEAYYGHKDSYKVVDNYYGDIIEVKYLEKE